MIVVQQAGEEAAAVKAAASPPPVEVKMKHELKAKKSLNEGARRREMMQIMEENKQIFEKLRGSRSRYDRR